MRSNFRRHVKTLTNFVRLSIVAAAGLLSQLQLAQHICAFHQFVPRVDRNDCPVRVHSNRVAPAELDDDRLSSMGGTLPLNHEDQPALVGLGQYVRPWPNNTGQLASEDYRPNELLKSKCQFIFLGAPDEYVQIIFHKFALPLTNGPPAKSMNKTASQLRCEDEDHVTAHVLVGSRMSKIHDFCGDEVPPQLMSARNLLTLNYVTRKSYAERQTPLSYHYDPNVGELKPERHGFLLEYRFLTDYGKQPAEVIKVANETCSFVFNGSIKTSGDLWSPNYPGFYPRNLDCQYEFHGREDQIVLISFEYFDVEGFAQCEEETQSDFILFSNYKTMDRTNRRFCGGIRPPTSAIASESNYFRMQFKTNDIFDGTGFYAHYQFFNQQMSQNTRIRLTTNSAANFRSFTFFTYFSGFFMDLLFSLRKELKQ